AKKEFGEILMDRAFLFSILIQFILISMLLFIYVSYSQISKANVPITVSINSNETALIQNLQDAGVRVLVINGSNDTSPPVPRAATPNNAVAAIDTSSKTVKTDTSSILSGFAIAKIKSVSEKVSFDEALASKNFDFTVERSFDGAAEFVQMGYGMLIPICIILPAVVAMSISTQSIFTERKRNTIELLLVSPIPNSSIAFYKTAPLVLVSVLCSAAWLILVSTSIPTSNIPLLLVVSFATSLLLVSLSVVISCKSKTVREANAFSSMVGMFVMVLLVLPHNPFSTFTPTSVMARAASNALDTDMLIGAGLLLMLALASFAWTLRAVGELRRSYT
ncbi:MAG: ABC transporter permease subunit, partial [Candidatus Micrarchaeota archaeon]